MSFFAQRVISSGGLLYIRGPQGFIRKRGPSGLIHVKPPEFALLQKQAEFVPDKFGFRRFPNDTDSLEQDLSILGEQFITYAKLYHKTLFVNATCEMLAEIPVVEPGPVWNLFWKMFDGLKFSKSIYATAAKVKRILAERRNDAAQKAEEFGFSAKPMHGSVLDPVYNVLHLRAEMDWLEKCLTFSFKHAGVVADSVYKKLGYD